MGRVSSFAFREDDALLNPDPSEDVLDDDRDSVRREDMLLTEEERE